MRRLTLWELAFAGSVGALSVFTLVRVGQARRAAATVPVASRSAATTTPAPPPRAVSPLFSPEHADLLEGPGRDRWQQPNAVVRALNIQPGEIVADIGAGTGYLLPALSKAAGAHGLVYEEDIQAAFLPALRQKARGRDNVRIVLGKADDPTLPRGSVDCFVLLTVYHEVEQPVAFLRTLRGMAKPNARLAIVDFDAGIRGNPPAPEGHWVAEQSVIEEARAAGWELSERHDFLRPASQFFLVFRPHKSE